MSDDIDPLLSELEQAMASMPLDGDTALPYAKRGGNGQLIDDSEIGLALQFAELHQDLRYVADRGRWYHWTGKVWEIDSILIAYDRVRDLLTAVAKEKPAKVATILKKAATIAAVEKIARADRRLVATFEAFDTDPWLLNTLGGVIDLRTGKIRPHKISDYFTKMVQAAPGGDCPRWLQFLDEVTGRDEDLAMFLQRVIGYCLTGSVREHALFFFYGTGRNGKGTFLNTLSALLDEYAGVAPMEMLTESKTDRHPTELASLQGRRFVTAQEVDGGRTWAEAKIKNLTGGDPITARYMRGDFFTFAPHFKLVIAANHKPSLRNVDTAMMARLHLVPFTVTIPKERRDPDLEQKLQAEWGGILQWAIDGCLQYQQFGLAPPEAVTEATAEYFQDQDTFTQWVEDCCEIGPTFWENPTPLFRSWEHYAKAGNIPIGDQKTFKEKLVGAGFNYRRNKLRGRHYEGVKLKPQQFEASTYVD